MEKENAWHLEERKAQYRGIPRRNRKVLEDFKWINK